MPEESRTRRLAILIDADNTSPRIAAGLFEEVAKFGEASVRRIYGDFSGQRLKSWADILQKYAIDPYQQFAYTTGKNASDMAGDRRHEPFTQRSARRFLSRLFGQRLHAPCVSSPGTRCRCLRLRRAEDSREFPAGVPQVHLH